MKISIEFREEEKRKGKGAGLWRRCPNTAMSARRAEVRDVVIFHLPLEITMRFKKHTLTSFVAFTLAGLANPAGAATETTQHEITQFTGGSASHEYSLEVNSFYNPNMGFEGWVHFSGWGYMKLKKGLPVTIKAVADNAGFHPGIAVWRNAGSAPIDYVKLGEGMMPYVQWGDVVENSVQVTDTTATPATTKKLGSLKMYFVTNGVDRDGWEEPADYAAASKFDQSLINRILDGTAGTVSVTFTPPVTGIYKFVVGGINPAAALKPVAPATSAFHKVNVTVGFPQK